MPVSHQQQHPFDPRVRGDACATLIHNLYPECPMAQQVGYGVEKPGDPEVVMEFHLEGESRMFILHKPVRRLDTKSTVTITIEWSVCSKPDWWDL